MYLKTLFLACVLPLALFSCKNEASVVDPITPAVDISEALLGTWETIEVKTESPTYQGLDTTIYQTIREADWGRLYGVRPSRTHYTADGKLKRTYYNVKGQITDITNGLWKAKGTDSLLVIEPNTTLNYRYELNGDRLTLTGTIDWDFDGEQDDKYRAVLRLVSRTN
ncbi:MAG: hypothetical protein ACI81P_002005 [Neolewinella sp.]|jgi:hypothetical protein